MDPTKPMGWAEGLILQLPDTHDGRNSWLLNYGTSTEADNQRAAWEQRNGRKCPKPRDDMPSAVKINVLAVYKDPKSNIEGHSYPKVQRLDTEDDGSITVIIEGNETQQAVEDMRQRKDHAYLERNMLVSHLASLFPSGTKRTDIPGWDPVWHGCVYIDTPAGQMSWHYHDSQAQLFAALPPYTKEWDGHTEEEKYERLGELRLINMGIGNVEKRDYANILRTIRQAESLQRAIRRGYTRKD